MAECSCEMSTRLGNTSPQRVSWQVNLCVLMIAVPKLSTRVICHKFWSDFSMSKLHFVVFDKSVGLNHWCAVTFTEGQAEMMSYMLIWKCWWSQHLFSLPVLLNQTWQEPCSPSISIALLAKEVIKMIFYWMLVKGISKREFIISACLLANANCFHTTGKW